MINWINKHLTHNRDKAGDFGIRVILHIPIGLVMSIPVLGWGLVSLFKEYENSEDKWCSDEAWKDYYGSLIGYVIGTIAFICLFLYYMVHMP